MNVIDLNADVGESYGLMHSGMDSEIIPHVTSVNIATGFSRQSESFPSAC